MNNDLLYTRSMLLKTAADILDAVDDIDYQIEMLEKQGFIPLGAMGKGLAAVGGRVGGMLKNVASGAGSKIMGAARQYTPNLANRMSAVGEAIRNPAAVGPAKLMTPGTQLSLPFTSRMG